MEPQPVTPRVSQVTEQMNVLNKAIDELANELEGLEKRLGTVLLPEETLCATKDILELPPVVDLAAHIRNQWLNLDTLIGRTRSLLRRIEL